MANSKNNHLLAELIQMELDGVLSDEQFKILQQMLSTDPEAFEYYIETILTISALQKSQGIRFEYTRENFEFDLTETACNTSKLFFNSNTSLRSVELSDLNFDADPEESDESGLTQAELEMLEMERTSPAVEIVEEEPKRKLIQKVEHDFKWFPGRPSKRKIRILFAMAACVMVFVGYVQFFVEVPVDRPVVAKLDDSINAEWNYQFQTPDESGEMVQSRYQLNKGYISILFLDGAKVIVEAPAELSLNSDSDMELFRGRIYAIVPEKAHGFTVKTPGSKVVDLGTEFGIQVDNENNTQLHVTTGRTVLFAGLLNGKKEKVDVNEGEAKKVYSDGFIKDIPLADRNFVRHIDSNIGSVWKGEREKILFAEYFDRVGHTAKTPLNHSPKWNFHHPVFINFSGTLDTDSKLEPYPSVVKEFDFESNNIYTISLDVINPTSGWIGLGFCRKDVGNYVSYRWSFEDTAIGWMRYGKLTPAIAAYSGVDSSSIVNINKNYLGAGLKGQISVTGGVYKEEPTRLMVKLDTHGNGEFFKVEYYQDGQKIAGPVSIPAKFFHKVGFSYKQTDNETENTDKILLDNFIITVRE